ncbi:MAG: 50S ribosomal protein L29 [Candidatus Levybacteria bacterium]|nr:50S ribosomal protein L29 [Candidatus Levybacteria bacterium]
MKLKEIIGKSDKELKELLSEKNEELIKLKLDNKLNKLKNTRSIFNARKEIARILTLIKERELALRQAQEESPKEEKEL